METKINFAGEQEELDEITSSRMIGGGVLFIIGIMGICGSTFVGYLMLNSGMLSDFSGFLMLYYAISIVFIIVTLIGVKLVHKSLSEVNAFTKMVSGIVFTVVGLIGASASTFVGYKMHGAGMLANNYGFDILFYLIAVVFIGVTFYGLIVISSAID